MKIRLAYKIFLSFLLLAVSVIVLMIVLIQQSTYDIFTERAAARKLGEYERLADVLADSYVEQGSWNKVNDEVLRDLSTKYGRWGSHSPGPPGKVPPRNRMVRADTPPLVLLDAKSNRVAGPDTPVGELYTTPIEVSGEAVGFLALKIAASREHGLNLTFFEKQTRAYYITGAVALLLAIVSALFFTRWIVGPVHSLLSGTRVIAKRDWSVRVPVKSKDELGELADSFNQMAAALERYEQMRTQLISDISHELRTPISILRGEVEAFQDGIQKPDKGAFDNLHEEVMRLGRIVEDMHGLTMADNGTLEYNLEPLDPLEVLDKTIRRYKVRLDEKQIDLESHLDGKITIIADASRLDQLYSNLLENTLRYTNSPGRLRIDYEVKGETLRLRFEDTAPGVEEENLQRIFDRMFRVDKARSRATGGSGLGLAICKTIVEAHGGTISASGGEMRGLVIAVEFPMGEA